MSRRIRVKPVANLISSRKRPKAENDEIEKEIVKELKEDSSLKDSASTNNNITEIEKDNLQKLPETDDTRVSQEKEKVIKSVNEKSDQLLENDQEENVQEQNVQIKNCLPDNDEETFKKPQTNIRSCEDGSSSSLGLSKNVRTRIKIQPRLRAPRATSSSSQKTTEEIQDANDTLTVNEISNETNNNCREETSQENEIATPPEVASKPSVIVENQNETVIPSPQISQLQPPSFHPSVMHHSRIRTESLCSLKSNMSGIGGVVRKNFRSEENQRIIDTKRESKVRLANKNLDKTQLLMFDMIYYNPTSNPMKTSDKTGPKRDRSRSSTPAIEIPVKSPEETEVEPSNNCLVPQVKLGPNGELILDEKSLVVENEQQKQNRILLANANVVYDDELSGAYGYYKRQKRTREWPPEETIRFYRCLHTIGTDFSLMLQLFPNRNRRDLKLKFKKEEKNNLALINKALMQPNTFDFDELKRNLDYDDEVRKKEAENKTKNEVNAILKKEILKKQGALKEKTKHKRKSNVDRIMTDAALIDELMDGSTTSNVKEKENDVKDTKVRRPKRTKSLKEPLPTTTERPSKKLKIDREEGGQPKIECPVKSIIKLATDNPPIIIESTTAVDTTLSNPGMLGGNRVIILNAPIQNERKECLEQAPVSNNSCTNFYNLENVNMDMDIDYSCRSNNDNNTPESESQIESDFALENNVELPPFATLQNDQGIMDLSLLPKGNETENRETEYFEISTAQPEENQLEDDNLGYFSKVVDMIVSAEEPNSSQYADDFYVEEEHQKNSDNFDSQLENVDEIVNQTECEYSETSGDQQISVVSEEINEGILKPEEENENLVEGVEQEFETEIIQDFHKSIEFENYEDIEKDNERIEGEEERTESNEDRSDVYEERTEEQNQSREMEISDPVEKSAIIENEEYLREDSIPYSQDTSQNKEEVEEIQNQDQNETNIIKKIQEEPEVVECSENDTHEPFVIEDDRREDDDNDNVDKTVEDVVMESCSEVPLEAVEVMNLETEEISMETKEQNELPSLDKSEDIEKDSISIQDSDDDDENDVEETAQDAAIENNSEVPEAADGLVNMETGKDSINIEDSDDEVDNVDDTIQDVPMENNSEVPKEAEEVGDLDTEKIPEQIQDEVKEQNKLLPLDIPDKFEEDSISIQDSDDDDNIEETVDENVQNVGLENSSEIPEAVEEVVNLETEKDSIKIDDSDSDDDKSQEPSNSSSNTVAEKEMADPAEQSSSNNLDNDDDDDDDEDYFEKMLGDVDLNSLVLVESQIDNKTIHQIYVMDPVTDELSERPLDLSPDIIENIRRVLESEDT